LLSAAIVLTILAPTAVSGTTHDVNGPKLFGIIFSANLNFQQQVETILKLSSQQGYLFTEAFQGPGLPDKHMECVLIHLCSPNFVMPFVPGVSSYPHPEGSD